MNENELQHYGVLGMKWGVRRYQNYDGSYTKKGLARYRDAESTYHEAKAAYKSGVGSKKEVRAAKRQLNSSYSKLKTDYRADQGKRLYQQGKTISGNRRKQHAAAELGILATSGMAQKLLLGLGVSTNVATVAPGIIAAGATTANLILAAKGEYEAKRLRAYYAHSS